MAPHDPKRVALGVDHGTRRTGFAAADASRILISPLDPVQGGDAEALDAIAALCEERDVGVLVVGYPLHMDGATGPRVAEVDAFITLAEQRFPELGSGPAGRAPHHPVKPRSGFGRPAITALSERPARTPGAR